MQTMVFVGQGETAVQVVGSMNDTISVPAHWQTGFPLREQQVAPGKKLSAQEPPPPQEQTPAMQVSLTRQRVPQVPQLVGSALVSTQAPAHAVVSPGQPAEGGGGGGGGARGGTGIGTVVATQLPP
jgi:hypothetical protein